MTPLPSGSKTHGLMAEFTTPAATLRAAETIRDAGYRKWDVFTPYPVRGMGKAMGLRSSRVGWFALAGGLVGYAGGMLMICYMNSLDYPLPVGGKPLFSSFSAFPTAYELAILFGAFGALSGMLLLNRLPRLNHPLLKHPHFALAAHDRFFVVIETEDAQYREPDTLRLLQSLGCVRLELIDE